MKSFTLRPDTVTHTELQFLFFQVRDRHRAVGKAGSGDSVGEQDDRLGPLPVAVRHVYAEPFQCDSPSLGSTRYGGLGGVLGRHGGAYL